MGRGAAAEFGRGRARRLLVVGVVALALTGCGKRTLSEQDCEAVRDQLEAAWMADGNQAASAAKTEEFKRFVKDEAQRIGERWMAQCRPMVGQQVDSGEYECLLDAKTIDEVMGCK